MDPNPSKLGRGIGGHKAFLTAFWTFAKLRLRLCVLDLGKKLCFALGFWNGGGGDEIIPWVYTRKWDYWTGWWAMQLGWDRKDNGAMVGQSPNQTTTLDTIRMQRSLAGGDGSDRGGWRLRKRREWTISSLRCSFTLLSELLTILLACLALPCLACLRGWRGSLCGSEVDPDS